MIHYQRENKIFIKYNGIPIIELMKMLAQKKLDSNVIKEAQFDRINETITAISKSKIA